MPFYTDYTNLIKINDVYLAKQYITNNIWYTNDSSLASSTWKNISVSNANSVAYSNGKWYVAKFDGVSIDLYSGTSLSSLSKKTIDSYVSVLADYGYDYGFVDMLSDGKYLYFVAWTTNYNDTEHGFYIGCVDGDLSSIDFYDNIGDFLQDNIDGISDNLIVADLYRNTIVLRFPSTGLLFSISTDAVKESDYQSYSQTQNNDLKTEVDILKPLKCAYGKAGFVIPGKKAAFIYPHYDNKKVTNFFLSVKNKLLSTFSPAPVVEPLSYEHNVSGTFVDYDGSSKTITKMKLSQAGIIEITDSTGGKYKFGDTEKYPIEIKNLVISAEQPSINISDINPMNNEMDIGSDNNRVRKIYANNLSGNVNEEGTTYKVWGAVFN